MSNVNSISLFFIFLILLFYIGLSVLQYFLSKLDNKVWGLILPVLSFLISLIYVLNIAEVPEAGVGAMIGLVLMVLFLTNLPTFVFLLIYGLQRKKRARLAEIDKMRIRDLE